MKPSLQQSLSIRLFGIVCLAGLLFSLGVKWSSCLAWLLFAVGVVAAGESAGLPDWMKGPEPRDSDKSESDKADSKTDEFGQRMFEAEQRQKEATRRLVEVAILVVSAFGVLAVPHGSSQIPKQPNQMTVRFSDQVEAGLANLKGSPRVAGRAASRFNSVTNWRRHC